MAVPHFNGMRIHVKTDGKLYKIQMLVQSVYDNDVDVFGFIVDQSKDWQVLEVFTYLSWL